MADYIAKHTKRQWVKFSVIATVVIFTQYFIVYNASEGNPPPIWFYILIILVFIAAFALSIRFTTSALKKFEGVVYTVDTTTITQTTTDGVSKQFTFEEIAIIDKKKWGLLIIKGNKWTKLNYLRPTKTPAYGIDSDKTIFIPNITTNFDALIAVVMQSASNASKF